MRSTTSLGRVNIVLMEKRSNCLNRWFGKLMIPFVVVSLGVAFSAWHARKISEGTLRYDDSTLPYFSTRFVFYPNRHMTGADDLGFKPGWIVSYAQSDKYYGTAFFVGFFGKMLTRGTPEIVTEKLAMENHAIEPFLKKMAEIDLSIKPGMARSNVIFLLGTPLVTDTNQDASGRFIRDIYDFEPRTRWHGFITNGFSIFYSNDMVIQKQPVTAQR